MKLHWRLYQTEWFEGWCWFPQIFAQRATAPYYWKEIELFWLKWGVALRWWWK